MKIFYINNFRGFQETYIPIKDVNFLVGENSTGKSSILSLLRLVSNHQFWSNDDFNTNDVELGAFDELLSKDVKGAKEFQIGYFIDEFENKKERVFKSVLATYKSVKGSPKLCRLKLVLGDTNINITIADKTQKFYLKQINYSVVELDGFKAWISDENFRGIKAKIRTADDDYAQVSFYEIRDFLRSAMPEKKSVLGGLIRPGFLPSTTWIAPIRTKPKRIYESFKLIYSPEGDHTPLLIKAVLDNQFKHNISKEQFGRVIEAFGKKSGLFDRIDIQNFGKDLSSPFVLNIYLNGMPLKITNVGYGVGQVLPLLAEILVSYKGRWFSIQQPEVHLHPRAQAALGEFLYDAVLQGQKFFLIETHSDFIIDRFRLSIKNGSKPVSSQVLFFQRNNNGNSVAAIDIDERGQYSEDQPKEFRDFFINEELNLLTL